MSKTHKAPRDLTLSIRDFGDPGAKRAAREIERVARIHRRRIVSKRARERLQNAVTAGRTER